MRQPKITIITASYNAAATIEQTISSVVCQDYPNIEYVIVDGGSTDETLRIIKKYEKYGIKWISESDNGLYDALNKGVQLATGDYIEIIGADDALTGRDIISRVVCQMKPGVDLLCGQAWYVDETSKTQSPFLNTNMRNKNTYRGGMTPHAAMFARREILIRYPFDVSYRISGDYKFFLQCFYDETIKIQYSDEMVAFFATSGISSNIKACWAEDDRIYRELGLPFHAHDYPYSSFWRRKGKHILITMNLFAPIRKVWRFINTHFQWKQHECENKICRWCGRAG